MIEENLDRNDPYSSFNLSFIVFERIAIKLGFDLELLQVSYTRDLSSH